ncbi:MAG TPA: hypothetical protein VN026_17455 [Bacteroidia bacterium]|jgi:hypothetical protein|nr:hypothetical protein [Bacteroidia bacterium]
MKSTEKFEVEIMDHKPSSEWKFFKNLKAEAEKEKAKFMKKMAHAEGISVSEYWYRHIYMNKKQREGAILLFAAVSLSVIKAKLGMPTKQADYLIQSQAIHAALVLNTGGFYTTLLPALLTLLDDQNTEFSTCIKNMKLGVLGAKGAKITAKSNLKITLNTILAFINGLAAANQAQSVEIITGCKMMVVGAKSVNKEDMSATKTVTPGLAKLGSLAGKNADKYVKTMYDWQKAIVPPSAPTAPAASLGWTDLPSTMVAKTTSAGNAAGSLVGFRKRTTIIVDGVSVTTDWSDYKTVQF